MAEPESTVVNPSVKQVRVAHYKMQILSLKYILKCHYRRCHHSLKLWRPKLLVPHLHGQDQCICSHLILEWPRRKQQFLLHQSLQKKR